MHPLHDAVLNMLSCPEPTPKDSNLVPDDFDLALRRMKTDLALLDLRRQLLRADLDAPSVLALTDRILELQHAARGPGPGAPRAAGSWLRLP